MALALVKGVREPHEVKKKSFDLGGNRTHDLRIRSTVTQPTELRGRTDVPLLPLRRRDSPPKSSPTFSVRPRSLVGRLTSEDLHKGNTLSAEKRMGKVDGGLARHNMECQSGVDWGNAEIVARDPA